MNDEQIEAIFKEFDTSGDGFIDFDELVAALGKAGKANSKEEVEEIIKKVDANNDGQISLEEFKEVFKLAPGAVPDALKGLYDVSLLRPYISIISSVRVPCM